jgi:hypothetical protein
MLVSCFAYSLALKMEAIYSSETRIIFTGLHGVIVSRSSAVGIATVYGLDDQGVGVRVPVGSEFSLLQSGLRGLSLYTHRDFSPVRLATQLMTYLQRCFRQSLCYVLHSCDAWHCDLILYLKTSAWRVGKDRTTLTCCRSGCTVLLASAIDTRAGDV